MNVTIEQLLAIIGGKEVDIIVLRQQLAAAQKRIKELEDSPDTRPEADK